MVEKAFHTGEAPYLLEICLQVHIKNILINLIY